MSEDDTITTCNYAIPLENGDVTGLVVSTDGEVFFSRLTILANFPDGDSHDLYDDQIFITSFDSLAPDHFILSEGTGKIIEIVGGNVRETADLRTALGGIHCAANGSILAWGPKGAIARREADTWTRLPQLQEDIHCARILDDVIYVAGSDGLFARLSDQGWEVLQLGTNVTLHGVFDMEPGVLVMGRAGVGGLWRDNVWTPWDLPEVSYYSIARFHDEIYVGAGSDGLYVVEGSTCKLKRHPLYAYKLRASESYLAIAGSNEIVRFNGKSYPCLEFNEDISE